MKTVFNIVLVLCAAALIYICYTSIMGPINFENTKKEREKAVIARLIDIRKAQQEYRSLHRGMYAPKLDTLIDFVKNQKLPFVMKKQRKPVDTMKLRNGDLKTSNVTLCG